MSPADADALLKYVQAAGVLGILILALIGFSRKWWVFGWTYADKEKESETNLLLAKSAQDNSANATAQAERVLELAEKLEARSRQRRAGEK